MDGPVESIVLCQDEENDKGHVDVMRISFLYVVKDLEYGQHLRQTAGKGVKHVFGVDICKASDFVWISHAMAV